jgi:hypothetical protein
MVVEYTLLAIVFVILFIGKIVADRQQELQRWFYYYEQKKITVPYPKPIHSWQEIPASYQDAFSPTSTLPAMIFIPGSRSVLRRRPEKLIVPEHDRLVVYEGSLAAKKEFPFEELLYIDHEKMLSAFWLTLVCQRQISTIRYLSKDDTCFSTILETLRRRSSQKEPSSATSDSRYNKLEELSQASYKFLRMARTSLLPEQTIVDVYFQPAYKSKKTLYGGLLRKTVTYAPHLSVLTNTELIVIQESEPIRTITYNQYAGKQLFIPYRSLREVHMKEDDATTQLVFSLNATHSVSLCFARENAQIHTFFENISDMIKNG